MFVQRLGDLKELQQAGAAQCLADSMETSVAWLVALLRHANSPAHATKGVLMGAWSATPAHGPLSLWQLAYSLYSWDTRVHEAYKVQEGISDVGKRKSTSEAKVTYTSLHAHSINNRISTMRESAVWELTSRCFRFFYQKYGKRM